MSSSPPPPLHTSQINTTAVADDSSADTTTSTTPWSFDTNWTVSRGSLKASIIFESPDFPIDPQSTAPKPPLVLVPPSSSDFEPCEIKIRFTQKHEIRQVYVRSTARNYEIYYAPALQSENEYLCTVRCSLADVEDYSFLGTDFKEPVSVNLEGLNGILPMGNVAGKNGVGTAEDDWVEVKLPAGQNNERNSLPNQTSSLMRNRQDYYEATAEINDSDPCMSLTLRLLSVQSKGCVYVDEVYVFAEPLDLSDTENQTGDAQNSSGSQLMTMLVPTLLGLAKSRATQLPDQSSKSITKQECLETEPEPAISANPVDEMLLKPNEAKAEATRFQVPAPVPDNDKICDSTDNNAASDSQVEKLLEQLVSRVSRIEDICLRFEENMLKPINSMELRLQRVEQQVEVLAENSQRPQSPSCPRVESEPNFLRNDWKDSQLCGACEAETTGFGSDEALKPPPEDTSVAVSGQSHPGLIVTAPEFLSCDEEDEVNDVKNSSPEKKTVSIDDSLAAALAGFSSSTVVNRDLTTTITPESSFEEERLKCIQDATDATTLEPTSNDEADKFSKATKVSDPELEGKNQESSAAVTEFSASSDTATEIPENSFGSGGTFEEVDVEATCSTNETSKTGAQLVEKTPHFDKADILNRFPSHASMTSHSKVDDGVESRVDYETPILEVKFASWGNHSSLKSPLQALLSKTDDPGVEETDEDEGEMTIREENTTAGNTLLVELDVEEVQQDQDQDLPPVGLETLTSLI